MHLPTKAFAVVVSSAAFLAGCGLRSNTQSAASIANATPTPTLQSVLMQVVLRPSDVPAGFDVGLYKGGDQVAGQVTLDLCGATFPSEAFRIARRQVAVVSGQTEYFSTEAVMYANAADRAEAVNEVMHAVAACPTGFVQGNVAGEPPLKTTFAASPDADWPATAGIDRLALDLTVSDQQGDSEREVQVFLSRGALLLGLYFHMPQQEPPIAGQTTAQGVARVFAGRLSGLSAAVVGR